MAQLITLIEADPWDGVDHDRTKALLGDAAKAAGVKKGVIMKSLRAALLGRLQGPDLITTWSLLAKIGEDLPRLRRCISLGFLIGLAAGQAESLSQGLRCQPL